MIIQKLIKLFYHLPPFERLFHTTVYLLKSELTGCQTVLDLGCGPDSPIQYCPNINYSLGVEPYLPYLKKSRAKKIHSKYIQAKIETLTFPKKSFDAVIMIEVLEHLPKAVGLSVLKKAEGWAKKKVIITTPNGLVPQQEIDDNKLQKHLSGWTATQMSALGYKVRGLSGLKDLRSNQEKDSMNQDLTSSIRYSPKLIWFFLATLSQAVTYYFPKWAFEIFCSKIPDQDDI